MPDIDAGLVIDALRRQVADLSYEKALAEAQVVQLTTQLTQLTEEVPEEAPGG